MIHNNRIKRGLILPDLQFPQHNPRLLELIECYMASKKWDYVVYLGDFLDMDAISHHAYEQGDMRSLEGKRLKDDYKAASLILRKHRKIVGKKCEIIFFLGNHEEWAEKFLDKFPQLEGYIEVRNNLPLDELNIKVIEPRHFHKIGKIVFVHGDISQGFGSKHHAMKMVDTYNRNVVYGHHHTLQTFTKISPVGIDETHTAHCLPCVANTAPDWSQDKPNSWLNGFGIFYTSEQSFSVFPIVSTTNGFISPEGEIWK